jgi:hypothetical protein
MRVLTKEQLDKIVEAVRDAFTAVSLPSSALTLQQWEQLRTALLDGRRELFPLQNGGNEFIRFIVAVQESEPFGHLITVYGQDNQLDVLITKQLKELIDPLINNQPSA